LKQNGMAGAGRNCVDLLERAMLAIGSGSGFAVMGRSFIAGRAGSHSKAGSYKAS